MTKHSDTAEWPKGLSKPALRALASAGYTRLQELDGVSAKELLQLHGMGQKGISTLRESLAASGLALSE
ncbi:hypothetical protein [Paenibacillus sp. NPDC058071]|uniref:hypothetical protein n=1 Tax=Paenibacillus sp. NPDC058071 TaxID=3346326 RepID=UPI0036DA74D8